ncbi:zinc finger protein 2 isoform X2 [Salmo trutta]|uniref:zinc finger protein 2 isoform X2 n=1 Tax=Salmo trutta TaxID=8032 RepID=UPI001130528C|nr:zinc finger protein 2-like isoform X2 [Salmo trutta]
MSKLQLLNVFLTKRLTAVAVEIYVEVEKTITEYQDEISSSKEEIKRLRRLLDLVFSPEIKLHRADLQQLSFQVSEEELPTEQQHCEQEWNPSLGQEDPEPTQIKEEQEELWTSQGEQLLERLDSDNKEFIFTPASGKNQEPPQPSHLFQIRIVDSPTNTTEIKTEPDGDGYRVSDKTFTCQICGKCFKRNWDLKRHMKNKIHMRKVLMVSHNTEKPYRCHVCGKRFNWESFLKRHMRTHTGEKPYFCNECGKCYGQIGHLRVHMRNHTGERPYRCSFCKKGFTTSFQLKQHNCPPNVGK